MAVHAYVHATVAAAGQYVCGMLLLLVWAAATWRPPMPGSQAHPSTQPMLLVQLVVGEGFLGVVSCAALRGRGRVWWLAWVCWIGSSCWGALSNQQRLMGIQEYRVRVAANGVAARDGRRIAACSEGATNPEHPPPAGCTEITWVQRALGLAPFLLGCVPWCCT